MKTKYIFLAALCIWTGVSCSLEEQSYTDVDRLSFIKDAPSAERVLLGVYQQMGTDGIYRRNLSLVLALPTDEAKVEGASLVGVREQGSNAYTNSDSYVQDTWAALYSGIYKANAFLETMTSSMNSVPPTDRPLYECYLAEARVLRALYYFELVRWFGHVPLVTKTQESYLVPGEMKQADAEDVYEFIASELEAAAAVLPWAVDDVLRKDNAFRISKGSALGLLTRVYATWAGYPLQDEAKWDRAVEAAAKVIVSGKHSLLEDYEQLWKNSANNVWAPEESLLEVSFYAPGSNGGSSGRIGKWNGVIAQQGSIKGSYNLAMYRVHPTFPESWKDRAQDRRRTISFADYRYLPSGREGIASATIGGEKTQITLEMAIDKGTPQWRPEWRAGFNQLITPAKWDIEKYVRDDNQLADRDYSNENWYVMRYADLLLLYAEALNEADGGPSSEAYDAINQVRRRGFGLSISEPSPLADLPAGLTQEEFRQAVRDERSYELAFEGQRRCDLVRWGIYVPTIRSVYKSLMKWHEAAPDYFIGAQYTQEGKNELLPIPLREVDLCGYEQNLNWM